MLLCSYFCSQPDVSDEILRMNTDDIINRTRLMENEIKVGVLYIEHTLLSSS